MIPQSNKIVKIANAGGEKGKGEKSQNKTNTIKDIFNALSKLPYDKLKDVLKSKDNGQEGTSSPHDGDPSHTTTHMTSTHATTTHATATHATTTHAPTTHMTTKHATKIPKRHVRITTKRKKIGKKIYGWRGFTISP